MSAGEVALRVRDEARHRLWQRRQVRPGALETVAPTDVGEEASLARTHRFSMSGHELSATVAPEASAALLAAADGLLAGRWKILGVERQDMVAPDWFVDPVGGRRAPDDRYCFEINHRREEETGNVKQIWEVSRHQHLTVLAAAWYLTGDDRYAEVVARQLRDWWRHNPFLSGVHWTSGIELGIRLISWVWIRRLLDGWSGVEALFEGNSEARQQIRWHQEYLAVFRSAGSSANNHVIAESAGQLVASCAFDWFADSDRWRRESAAALERELERNTFPSGLNRELASAYHGFVAELGLVAAIEAHDAGHPLSPATAVRLCQMLDAAAAIADERLRPPRQGDDDEGRCLLLDAPAPNPWPSLLAAGAAVFGPLPWWPPVEGDVRSTLLGALALNDTVSVNDRVRSAAAWPGGTRPTERPSHFPDAGMTILRSASGGAEIWCRCDSGPHGYLAIAAHAHADALSVEVRHGGVDILADPGTFCYHGQPEWRAYFRSTLGHNTLELAGRDQSESGGPFLWVTHAGARSIDVAIGGEQPRWSGEHDGYSRLDPPAVHYRTVALDGPGRWLEIVDRVAGGPHPGRLAFHLGPDVAAVLEGTIARLSWPAADGTATATLYLAAPLRWSAHRGESDPVAGWYSACFGHRQPATTLLGTGLVPAPDGDLRSLIEFDP
jgi:hypothetical protein